MNEDQEYIDYIEEEFKLIREFLDEYDQFNSGSLADDVIAFFKAIDS